MPTKDTRTSKYKMTFKGSTIEIELWFLPWFPANMLHYI